MDHVAILKSEWKLLPKILSGEKTVESRWYRTKRSPWNEIHAGDTVYLKESGKPVTARALVARVERIEDLTLQKVNEILKEYGKDIGIAGEDVERFSRLFKDKAYCLLVFLKQPEKVSPFDISKKGFGLQTAWLAVGDIERVKI